MTECPAFVPNSLCELTQFLPTQPNAGQEITSFLFGVLVVVVFSIDRYKVPTYAKTTIGDFIELAPESLTSHARYLKGLGIYIALMLGLYAVLVAIGPTTLSPILTFLSGKPGGAVDSSVWPLAATSIITLIGSRNDEKYLGRMEQWLRSVAHEAAYIPAAVVELASALDGSFALTEDELRAADALTPATRTLIQESQEGFRQNWLRARYLYSRLQLLSDRDDFKALINQPENVRALSFIEDQMEALAAEVDRSDKPDDKILRKAAAFKRALAVFLASILWRCCDNEAAVNTKLNSLRLNVSAPEPQSLATLMFNLCVYLGGAALAIRFALEIRNMLFRDLSINLKWHLTLAFMVLLTTAFFVTRWREKQLTKGEWKYGSDAILRCSIACAIGAGAVSAFVTFALHQGGAGTLYAMLLVGFVMALPSALLFQLLMRWAAMSPPTSEAVAEEVGVATRPAELIRTAVRAGAIYAVIAFVAILGPLYWFSQYIIVAVTPLQIVDMANESISNIRAATVTANSADQWFTDFASQSALHELEASLWQAKRDLTSNEYRPETIPSIVTACENLGKLSSNKNLFAPGCEIGDDLRAIDYHGGDMLRLLYTLQGQISALKPSYAAIQNYAFPVEVQRDWKNAVLAGLIWAAMAAVFAVSVLLYRRQLLWNGLASKKLPDFVPDGRHDREAWLRTPLYKMGKLTPLEALRYEALRARLADLMNPRAGQPEKPRLQIVA
jgi:hypothetical protein